MRPASLRMRTRRSRRAPMPAPNRAALLAEIAAHKARLEEQRARIEAAEQLVAELVKSEARLTEMERKQ
jgi:hypothetical protein